MLVLRDPSKRIRTPLPLAVTPKTVPMRPAIFGLRERPSWLMQTRFPTGIATSRFLKLSAILTDFDLPAQSSFSADYET